MIKYPLMPVHPADSAVKPILLTLANVMLEFFNQMSSYMVKITLEMI